MCMCIIPKGVLGSSYMEGADLKVPRENGGHIEDLEVMWGIGLRRVRLIGKSLFLTVVLGHIGPKPDTYFQVHG